jgi:putative ubiquitin-RnfH superfamily antitoxin RatB of RatAB toxin-antitoxin module
MAVEQEHQHDLNHIAQGQTNHVTVCFAQPHHVWLEELALPQGSTLAEAVQASQFSIHFPDVKWRQSGLGVFGQKLPLDAVVQDQDRIEIYRTLAFEPNESRHRRAAHRARLLQKPKEPLRSRKSKA